jgi:sterol 3beta-glucosyltransferase
LPAIGLIFLYRHNRRAVLDATGDANGIRLNIPLSRIATVSKSQCLSFAWMISITIGADNLASNGAAVTPPVENDSLSDGTSSEVLSQDSDAEPYVVQFGAIRKDPIWDNFMSYVETAKAAMAGDATEWAGSNVYIDFDPRAELEDEDSEDNGLSGLQKSVSHALGLDPTKEFYSEWKCPSARKDTNLRNTSQLVRRTPIVASSLTTATSP